MKLNSEFQMESGFMETFSSDFFRNINDARGPVFTPDDDYNVEDEDDQEVPWDVYEDEFSFRKNTRNSDSVHNNSFQVSKSNITPTKTKWDGLPFRDRFANAAFHAQKLNSLDFNSRLSSPSPPPPPQTSPFSQLSQGSISSTDDSNYVSFGNQSVTSDVTESEHSIGGSMASRDLRRKARLSKMNTSFEKKQLPRVKEEERGVKQDDFFGNRSSSLSRSTTSNLQEEDIQHRSKSAPKVRPILSTTNILRSSSPPRSTASAASSSIYKGWPGTMDANGGTVSVADSNSNSSISFTTARKMFESKIKVPSNLSNPVKGGSSLSTTTSKRTQVSKTFHKGNEREHEYNEDIVDLDIEPTTSPQNIPKPSDYHLAAAIATAKKSLDVDTSHRTANTSMSTDASMRAEDISFENSHMTAPSPDSTPIANKSFEQIIDKIDTSASEARLRSTGRNISPRLLNDSSDSRSNSSVSPLSMTSVKKNTIRLSEDALRENERHSGSFLSFVHGANVRGYRGFIDKTADIPNLLDDESVTSASTMATNRRQDLQDSDSDVFDGLSSVHGHSLIQNGKQFRLVYSSYIESTDSILNRSSNASKIGREEYVEHSNIPAVKKFTLVDQTTRQQLKTRDFDADLRGSDTSPSSKDHWVDTTKIYSRGKKYDRITMPRVTENSEDGSDDSDSSGSSFGLEMYVIDPSQTRKLVKVYRSISEVRQNSAKSLYHEDAKKAFALFEMRSRIMQTDLERGFDRAGGTIVVDDIATTEYMMASCRVRDAVIVSKAWKDGASAHEARVAYRLTKDTDYYIERRGRNVISRKQQPKSYEKVTWIDDTEFSLIRCFGVKTLRGVDIFTLGDCQSMLLKMTHEYSEVRYSRSCFLLALVCLV